jgi:Transposase IS116/IS110/IS902 family
MGIFGALAIKSANTLPGLVGFGDTWSSVKFLPYHEMASIRRRRPREKPRRGAGRRDDEHPGRLSVGRRTIGRRMVACWPAFYHITCRTPAAARGVPGRSGRHDLISATSSPRCGRRERRVRELLAGHPTLEVITSALLSVRAVLRREVNEFERRLQTIARTDTQAPLLMTTPSVGVIVALTFACAIDDPSRFKSSKAAGGVFRHDANAKSVRGNRLQRPDFKEWGRLSACGPLGGQSPHPDQAAHRLHRAQEPGDADRQAGKLPAAANENPLPVRMLGISCPVSPLRPRLMSGVFARNRHNNCLLRTMSVFCVPGNVG